MHATVSTPCPMPTSWSSALPSRRREDAVQSELVDGYGLLGGLVSTGELIELMRPHWRQPSSVLTRWMIGHKVLSFSSRTLTLLPLFQFERPRLVPHGGVGDVALELAKMMGDEDLAAWFLRPSQWLEHERPADVVTADPDLVLIAARKTTQALMARRMAN
jgi:hypothetical protein